MARFTVVLPPRMHQALERYARTFDVGVNDLVECAIKALLEEGPLSKTEPRAKRVHTAPRKGARSRGARRTVTSRRSKPAMKRNERTKQGTDQTDSIATRRAPSFSEPDDVDAFVMDLTTGEEIEP